MLESLLDYLRQGQGPLAYALLAGGAAIEYVFPPFPGDTVVLFGAFLAATAGYSPVGVYLVMTAGSVVGSLGAYLFGRYFGDDARRLPRWLRTNTARAALQRVDQQFQRYGAAYLAVNRFLPALRAFFFIGAGLARMPVGRVLLFGGLSAAVWNALVLAVGYAVGTNWDRLQHIFGRYSEIVLAVLVLLAVFWALRRWVTRGRRGPGPGPGR